MNVHGLSDQFHGLSDQSPKASPWIYRQVFQSRLLFSYIVDVSLGKANVESRLLNVVKLCETMS